jgi:hypothetical protein
MRDLKDDIICKCCGESLSSDNYVWRISESGTHTLNSRRCKACLNDDSKIVKQLIKIHPKPEDGKCMLCGHVHTLHCDHDHDTGEFRGWICNDCNTGLGKMGDRIENMENAVKYLNKKRIEELNKNNKQLINKQMKRKTESIDSEILKHLVRNGDVPSARKWYSITVMAKPTDTTDEQSLETVNSKGGRKKESPSDAERLEYLESATKVISEVGYYNISEKYQGPTGNDRSKLIGGALLPILMKLKIVIFAKPSGRGNVYLISKENAKLPDISNVLNSRKLVEVE